MTDDVAKGQRGDNLDRLKKALAEFHFQHYTHTLVVMMMMTLKKAGPK